MSNPWKSEQGVQTFACALLVVLIVILFSAFWSIL